MVASLENDYIYLTGMTNPGQNGPLSNGSEEVLHILPNSRTEATSSHYFVPYPGPGILI